MEGIKFAITADNQQFINAMNGVRSSVRETMHDVERSGQSVEEVFMRLKNAAALSFAGFSGAEFIKQVANVRGQFQQLEVAFTTMLGSEERANTLMNQLVKTAATTPFDLKGVADGAKSLMAYGTAAEDVNEMIVRLGDIAAGMSIDLKDLVYLYGTTMVQGRMFTQDLRQFQGRGIPIAEELAKVLNVAKEEVPDLVTAGKVTGEVLQQAIVNMTNEGGKFGGLMAAQSKTIVGQISNIEDAFDMMFNDIGKQSEGLINASLGAVSFLIEHWQQVGAAILAVVETAGIYKATLATMSAMNTAATNIGYDAEIAALQALLPLKEQEAASDLQNAVSSGQLTEQKAMQIAALREEAAAHVANLQAIAAEDAANAESAAQALLLAQNRDAEAQRALDYYQKQYDKIVELGDGFAIEKAEEELNTAASVKNTTAKELQTAAEAQQAAATKASASSKAAETAQTNLNTASEAGNAAATGILAQAKLALKRAVDAVNASFLASPLFWIAAAIAGVTFAVYKLVTAESAEEASVRRVNDALDDQNQKLQDRKANIENLIRTVQDENATDLQRYQAYQKLASIIPELTEKYSQQELAAMKLDDVQKMLNEDADAQKQQELKKSIDDLTESIEKQKKEMESLMSQPNAASNAAAIQMLSSSIKKSELDLKGYQDAYFGMLADIENMKKEAQPIEVKLEEAKGNAKLRDDIYEFYEKAILYTEELQNASSDINYTEAQNRFDTFVSDLKDEVENLRSEVEGKPADFKLLLEYQEKQKVLDDILGMKNEWSRTGVTTIPLYFQMHYIDAEQAKKEANKTFNYLTGQMEEQKVETKTAAQWRAQTLKAWNDAKKELQDFKNSSNKMSEADYKAALKNKTEAEAAAKKAYQEAGGDVSGKKGGNKNNNAKNDAARQRAAALQEERRYQEELDKIRREAEDARIDATIAAIEDEGIRERAEQDEQHKRSLREIAQQAEEMRKAIYEHNKKVWENAHKDGVYEDTKEGKAGWSNIALSEDQQQLINSQLSKENAEYSRLIEKRVKDEEKANQEAINSYIKQWGDYAQKRDVIYSEANDKICEYEEELARATTDEAKQAAQARIDTVKAETQQQIEELDSQYGKAKAFMIDLFEDASEKSVAEIDKIIKKYEALAKFLGGDGTVTREQLIDLGFSDSEIDKAIEKLNRGEITVKEFTDKIKELNVELEQRSSWISFTNNITKALDKIKNSKGDVSKIGSGIEGIGNAVSDFAPSLKQFSSDLANIFDFDDTKVQSAIDGLEGIGSTAAGVGQIMSGDIVGGVMNTVNGVSKIVSAFDGLFGADYSQYNRMVDEYNKLIDVWDDLIDRKSEYIEMSYGTEAERVGKEAIDIVNRQIEAYQKLGKERLNAGASAGSHSIGVRMSKEMDAQDWENIAKALNTTVNNAKNLLGGRLTGLFDLTSDQLQQLKEDAPEFWANMDEDVQKYLQGIIDGTKKIEDLQKQVQEQLTSTSFDSLKSNFASTLYDLSSTAKDGGKNIGEALFKSIVDNFILGSEFDTWLAEFYRKWADKIGSGTMTKSDWDAYNEEYQRELAKKIAERDQWAAAMGYTDNSAYEQKASSGGWQSMGQDTADELNGRFTALQMSGERISEGVLSVVAMMTTMNMTDEENGRTLSEIRNLMVTNNSYLEDILVVNKKMRDEFNAKLDKISTNTK